LENGLTRYLEIMTISRSIDESLQVDCKSSAKLKVERVKNNEEADEY